MRVTVIGANGQLGHDIVLEFQKKSDDVCSLTHDDIEVQSVDSVNRILQATRAEVVVNTSAMHNVERCEQDPNAAFAVNTLGARYLADITRKLGALLVHVSTDYVFDGTKREPYTEQDAPLPVNVYGNTKLAGEYFVRTLNPKHFVLRTSALYGKSPCRGKGGLNFVELMLKLARERGKVRVVDNEVVTPTATADLARQIVLISHTDAYGLYHATAEGSCSWYQFAKAIFEDTKTQVQLEIADPNEFPAKVPRPTYSVLENFDLKADGLNMFSNWREGLKEYLGILRPKSAVLVTA
jgi:dTDP-4-dehydrorhamnose reductase